MTIEYKDKDGKRHKLNIGKHCWISVDMPDKDGEKQYVEYGLEEVRNYEPETEQYVTHGEISMWPSNSRGICVEPGSHRNLIIKPTK